MNRKLNKIKENLERELKRDTLIFEAWEAVQVQKKKDGSDYKLLSKAFSGAYYRTATYSDYHVLEITVHNSELGYINDWIRLKDTKNNDITDVSTIASMIEKKKDFFKEEIAKDNDRLNKLDTAFVEFETAYTKALGQLAYNLGCTDKFDSLFYRIKEIVTNN
jgi:hypothetical protein